MAAAKPEWSNDIPNATKNAIIEAKYDTCINGNFESQNLTINEGGTLYINAGGYITVNGQIVNRNSAESSFVLDNDANLLQNTAAPNVGKITVKKLKISNLIDKIYRIKDKFAPPPGAHKKVTSNCFCFSSPMKTVYFK